MPDVAAAEDQIRLSLPARHQYARVARIATSSLALRLGFTYREVEDLRLAVDEMLVLLIGADRPSERMTLRFGTTPGHVTLAITADFDPASDEPARERFESLVGDLVDDWRISDDGRTARIEKRHRVPSADEP